jgi:hypothetical protein
MTIPITRSHLGPALAGLAFALAGLSPAGAAMPAPLPVAQAPGSLPLLNQQREQLLQLSRQQQVLLQEQLRCLDRAATIKELDRCRLSMPAAGMHGVGMQGVGGWHCPMP